MLRYSRTGHFLLYCTFFFFTCSKVNWFVNIFVWLSSKLVIIKVPRSKLGFLRSNLVNILRLSQIWSKFRFINVKTYHNLCCLRSKFWFFRSNCHDFDFSCQNLVKILRLSQIWSKFWFIDVKTYHNWCCLRSKFWFFRWKQSRFEVELKH